MESISLVTLTTSTTLEPDALPDVPPRLALQYKAEGFDVPATNRVVVLATLTIVDEPSDSTPPTVNLTMTHRLVYSRPASPTPTRPDVQQFADANGIFNVWPYWREMVHTLAHRMELPLPMLPLYRVDRGLAPAET